MKVKVNRQLSAGQYHVNFEVGDFSPDELAKMSSFGIPYIRMRWNNPNPTVSSLPLTQINTRYDGIFSTESEAKDYEKDILDQIKGAMDHLRESQDKFSSFEEVDL